MAEHDAKPSSPGERRLLDPAGDSFSRDKLDRIVAESFVEHVEFYRTIASTNDRALEVAGSYHGPFPLLVLAEKQTAGRGRGANRWWAGKGALTFSLLLETEVAQLPGNRWPLISLTAGLAVCEAVEELLLKQTFGLKWPNDVYVQGRKVSGILAEAPGKRKTTLVVGIGINVNNSWKSAPPELRSNATALCDVAARTLPLIDVLLRVLGQLADRLSWIGSREQELHAQWRKHCVLTDRTIELQRGARRLAGICRGIDSDGALLIETDGRLERCYSGVVTHFDH